MNDIVITLTNGHSITWDSKEWDDYSYDGRSFIVKKKGAYVGIYNMSHIISVVVK